MVPDKCAGTDTDTLLRDHLDTVCNAAGHGPILDLACGTGRNGLCLLRHGVSTIFADLSPAALQTVTSTLNGIDYAQTRHLAQLWQADFEQDDEVPLAPDSYGGIIVFRYLHRPLLPFIRAAVRPGGVVVYETFTVDQAQFGRPKNPDFLLRHGELLDTFRDWQVLHSFEGIVEPGQGSKPRAIAQVVATRP